LQWARENTLWHKNIYKHTVLKEHFEVLKWLKKEKMFFLDE